MKHAAAVELILGQIRWYARQAERLRTMPAHDRTEREDLARRSVEVQARRDALAVLVEDVAPSMAGRVREIIEEARIS